MTNAFTDWVSRLTSSWQCTCPFYSFCAGFCGKSLHHPILSAPYSTDLAPCAFWLYPQLKLPLKRRRFANATLTQYTSSVYSIWLPTYQPHGKVTVHGRTARSPLTDCHVTSSSHIWFLRYSKWTDTPLTALIRNEAFVETGNLKVHHCTHTGKHPCPCDAFNKGHKCVPMRCVLKLSESIILWYMDIFHYGALSWKSSLFTTDGVCVSREFKIFFYSALM